ncbi:MAG: CapA family protein, partial [Halobacteriales archaeon]|nr:CapA family protein [Halobacteriales archaeon]
HVLDWSRPGLEQTLRTLHDHDVRTAGAGRDALEAWTPAVVDTSSNMRVAVLAVGSTSSGIPGSWSAGHEMPGVALLPDLSDDSVDRIATIVGDHTAPNDIVILSIHWGGNWGYPVPEAHRRFARRVIDGAGIDVVHGHSSHHPLGIEVHRDRPIIYGCGDLITDYEGIGGHDSFRPHLGGVYEVTVDPSSRSLRRLDVIPTEVHRFQLRRPSEGDTAWLASVLDREGSDLGTGATLTDQGRIRVTW